MERGRAEDHAARSAPGKGERIVFLPYTREVFAQTQQWSESHQLFAAPAAQAAYDEAVLT